MTAYTAGGAFCSNYHVPPWWKIMVNDFSVMIFSMTFLKFNF
jgi:hypothetical protein